MFLLASTTVMLGLGTLLAGTWFFSAITDMGNIHYTFADMLMSAIITFVILNMTVLMAQHTDELYPGTFTKEKQ